jgi:hypothetical protein
LIRPEEIRMMANDGARASTRLRVLGLMDP